MAGIFLSYRESIASGAAVVLCLGAVLLFSLVCSPRYGAAARVLEFIRERRSVRHSP